MCLGDFRVQCLAQTKNWMTGRPSCGEKENNSFIPSGWGETRAESLLNGHWVGYFKGPPSPAFPSGLLSRYSALCLSVISPVRVFGEQETFLSGSLPYLYLPIYVPLILIQIPTPEPASQWAQTAYDDWHILPVSKRHLLFLKKNKPEHCGLHWTGKSFLSPVTSDWP